MITGVRKKSLLWSVAGLLVLALVAVFAVACAGAQGTQGPQGVEGPPGPEGPPGAPAPAAPGAGLKAAITRVDIGADRKPVVTFTIKDARGKPLKISDLDGYPGFILSYIKEDPATRLTQYVAYTVSDVKGNPYTFKGETMQPVLSEVKGRPAFDPRAATPAFPAEHPAFNDLGDGTFTYTFSTVLPEGYDTNATHRIGGQFTRAARAFVANPTLDFVPAGGDVKVTRQIVSTQSCNTCHDPLAAHGGSRREPALCVTCHTPQNIDPETGNTPQFNVMVHKIHRGANLPSVQDGKDYVIVGFNQTPFDFSEIQWPQDVRNCTTCHSKAPDADNWKTAPSRAACGACHDNLDWATGKSTIAGKRDHPGGPQLNDASCKACHQPDSGKEFDASIAGAHTIPTQSKQLAGLVAEIVSVAGTGPGQTPTVIFTAKDEAGKVIPLASLTRVAFNVAGPTTDYTNQWLETGSAATMKDRGDGTYSYTLQRAMPADATGTYAVGLEVRRVETITGNNGEPLNVNVDAYNPVAYVAVTDSQPQPRRVVVKTESCNQCHQELAFHGGSRKNTSEYCEFCHNPAAVDVPNLAPGGPYDIPPQSINFRLLIHRVHTGEELTEDFTIYRSRGIFNFNEIRFPGDRRNCAKCHDGDSYKLPLSPTMANTLAPREPYSPLGPAASACLGCHDSRAAAAHARTMTAPQSAEACATCHGSGKDFDVAKVHAR